MSIFGKSCRSYIVTSTQKATNWFLESLNQFNLGQVSKGAQLKFLGCDIRKGKDCYLTFNMNDYMAHQTNRDIGKSRMLQQSEGAKSQVIHGYKSMAGTLLYLRWAVSPQPFLIASRMQQRLGAMRLLDIVGANRLIWEPYAWICYQVSKAKRNYECRNSNYFWHVSLGYNWDICSVRDTMLLKVRLTQTIVESLNI